jgi:hypothetical protein
MPINYQNGKIYCIRSHQTEQIYIGSTVNSLSKRLNGHRNKKKRFDAGKCNNITSFEILKFDDHYIELVELYPCNSKMELERREGQIIRAEPNCVNKMIAGRTKAEYYQDNREQINQKHKQYYQDNREQINQKNKQYKQDNREAILRQKNQYRQDNLEKIKSYKNQKHDCDCGGKYTTSHKASHMKTEKHRVYAQKILQ